MKVKEKVIEIIAAHSEINNLKEYLMNNDDLSPLNINSIDFIKMVIDFETEFEIEFDDEALSYTNFLSLHVLCEYIVKLIENGSGDKINS